MWQRPPQSLKRLLLRHCTTTASAPSSLLPGFVAGAVAGAGAAVCLLAWSKQDPVAEALERLPGRIILVRHGESEGNADHTLYRTKADNLIELTEKGSEQALDAGKRVKKITGDDKVTLVVSPFQRTLQTARNLRLAFEDQILRTYVTPQIREQEFGNLQGDDFKKFREEQKSVGRLYYRFPTGESGCDVYDRTKSWWDGLMRINERPNYGRCDSVVVVTHGLTMRLILMQLHGWSPTTFHTVWNADNCAIYVLKKDLSHGGFSPYTLDAEEGDSVKSSTTVMVELKTGEKKALLLTDYLSIPQPRTSQQELVAQMLAKQHGIDPRAVAHIDFWGGQFAKYR